MGEVVPIRPDPPVTRPGEYPPAPPPITRDDSRLSAEEVRRRIAALKAKLEGTTDEENTCRS